MTLADPTSATASAEGGTAAHDPRTFWRVGVALALPVGPLLVTIARGIMPYWTSQDPVTVAAEMAAHPTAMEVVNWIDVPLLAFALITVLGLGYVARRGAPVLAAIGTLAALFSYTMGTMAGPSDYLGWVMSTDGYSVNQVATLSTQLNATAMATFVGLFWVVVHILAMVILACALYRARVLPLWATILLALSQPVHLTGAIILPSRWLDVFGGWGMTTLICVFVALRVLRTSNEDWDLPRTHRDAAR